MAAQKGLCQEGHRSPKPLGLFRVPAMRHPAACQECLLHGLPPCPSFGGADLFPKINPLGLLPLKEDFSSCLSIRAAAALPLQALVTALASHSSSAQQQVTAEILLPPANPLPCAAPAACKGQEWCGLQPSPQGPSAPPDAVKLPDHPQAQLLALQEGHRLQEPQEQKQLCSVKAKLLQLLTQGKG